MRTASTGGAKAALVNRSQVSVDERIESRRPLETPYVSAIRVYDPRLQQVRCPSISVLNMSVLEPGLSSNSEALPSKRSTAAS